MDRRSNGSSIAVYFTSNIVDYPLYLLKGREVKSKGRNLNVYFNRLLTPDETLYWKVRNLVKARKVKSCFISKRHIVHMYKLGEDKPFAVAHETVLHGL